MFQLHDRTRRQLGLLAFVMLCLVPTVIVLASGVVWRLPHQAGREADRLSSLLGLQVSLQKVEYPRPGVIRYAGLELTDAETGKTVLRSSQLETQWHTATGKQERAHPCLILTATDPQLEADGLAQVWRLVHEVLTCRADRAGIDVRLSSAQLTLRLDDSPLKLVDVRGSLDARSEGTMADVHFRLADSEKGEGVKLRIGRNRQTEPATTGFALQTGETPLPCLALATAFPLLKPLGQSRFQGDLWGSEAPGGWSGGLRGWFSDLDLERLLDGRSPQKILGAVQVAVEEGRFEHGRIEQLTGSMVGGQGKISRSLLEAAVTHLGLARSPELPGTEPLLPYEQLRLRFTLDSRGLTLRGQCQEDDSGVIFVDRYGPLLGQTNWQSQPVVALVRTLVPSVGLESPVTKETDWLLRYLPLPEGSVE